ncbi:methyl-accepting chemotaxis protein [Tissierella creatinophila]|uniref:Methyl-accepting chemotaxis protein McpA n=1 Tax=Tissierella creatinophila DSM 6911 TaxID=1123403 RepID=A0A1U7M503_TISCR|nr:methyl-accepting chemotaxis protein [Tissierella creatinophila]OLS02366.1 methyl-accepting chemotaxis protein McpA [Tissierella creatinophila DSM 6911]
MSKEKSGRFKSIKFKIISTMIIICILSIVSSISVSYISSSGIVSNLVDDKMRESVKFQSETISTWLEERIKYVESHSINPLVKEMNIESAVEYLKNDIEDKKDIYDVFFIADLNGDYISTRDTNNVGNIKDRDYFKEVLKGETVLSNVVNSKTTGKPISVIASPIKDHSGKIVGVLAGSLDLNKLSSIIEEFSSVKEERYSFIIDNEGLVLAHPNKDIVMKENISIKSNEVGEDLVKASKEILNGDNNFVSYSQKGTTINAYYNKIEISNGWSMVTKIPKDIIYKPLKNMLSTLIYVGISSLIFVVIISIFVGKSLSNPIISLSDEINKVGDLELSLDGENTNLSSRKDEIGSMRISIINMKTKLINIINSILNISSEVSNDSNKLTSSIDETSKSIDEVAKTVEEMAQATSEQARNTEEGLNRLVSLSRKIDGVNTNAKLMEEYIDETRVSTQKGSHSVSLLNVKMADNDKIAGKVADSVVSLLENSKAIGDISNKIGEIAEHVNLLSLNATIEAARAGEHGKGFAVVADEIRRLAHATNESSGQIVEIVRNVQNEIEETNQGMVLAGETITELRKVIDDTEIDFKNISDFVLKIVNQVEVLGKDIVDITMDKEDVVKSIQNIAAISEQSSAGAQEISASIEEQSAIIQQILNMADNFNSVTNKLNLEIAKFKL